MRFSSRSFSGLVFELYHVPIQPAGLVAVGINFVLGLMLVDVEVLTGFPLFQFGAADKLAEAFDAAEFVPALKLPLACDRLPPFHVCPKDPEAFWNGLAESLANLILI